MSGEKTDPLTELLDSLPIGISAKVAGVTFYQNRLGVEHTDLAGSGDVPLGERTIKVEELKLKLFDADCDVRLTRDVTDQRELEDKLDPRRFQRIHRSTIVNVARVRELRSHLNGEYFLILDSGQQLKLSRSYKDKVRLLH